MRHLLTRILAGRRGRRAAEFCESCGATCTPDSTAEFCETCAAACTPDSRRESRLAAAHRAALNARLPPY